MIVSIIVPTYDRAKSLKDTLQCLVNQDCPKKKYEIIVADNCISNNVKKFITEFKSLNKTSNIRYLLIPKQGVNKARNEAIKISNGDIVAFTDDDIIVNNYWLKSIISAHQKYPHASVIGGRVELMFDGKPPFWLSEKMKTYLAYLNFGDLPLHNPPWLVGANLTFKKNVFKEVGYFSELIGRKKGEFMFRDEIELLERISDSNKDIMYDPSITVYHHVGNNRLTLRYMCKRTFWEGRSEQRVTEISHRNTIKYGLFLLIDPFFNKYYLFVIKIILKAIREFILGILTHSILMYGYLYQMMIIKYNKKYE